MKTALITGVSGQDGSYLAEFLLGLGDYRVIGTARDAFGALHRMPESLRNKVEMVSLDLLSSQAIVACLKQYRPQEIYNFAAYSSGAGMYEDPCAIGEVNGLVVTRLLECIRQVDVGIRFVQASSREVFGEPTISPQTEITPTQPRSPYGAAKLYADSMVQIHRNHYGLFACSAILYNHESPRRGLEFVTRKVSHGAATIAANKKRRLSLGNLDAQRDWGFAGDYVRAMWLMLQSKNAADYVIATGKSHSVRELCDVAFQLVNLDYRDHVDQTDVSYRKPEPHLLVGSSEKATKILGWTPKISFYELVDMMVENDVSLLKEG